MTMKLMGPSGADFSDTPAVKVTIAVFVTVASYKESLCASNFTPSFDTTSLLRAVVVPILIAIMVTVLVGVTSTGT